MTREQYIQFRVNGNWETILFMYFLEKGYTKLNFSEFKVLFNKWMLFEQQVGIQTGNIFTIEQIIDWLYEGCTSYYDVKFTIIYLEITKTIQGVTNKTKIMI